MEGSPLNPALFERLQLRFRYVKITNAGQSRRVDYIPDIQRPGKLRAVVQERGEQYAFNCPFCGDKRQRLYLSYMYGVCDPVTGSSNHGLWWCHNEHCHEDRDKSGLLRSYTAIPIGRRGRQVRAAAACADPGHLLGPAAVAPTLPPGISVGDLPATHPAVTYLYSRGFNPQVLAREWGVGYCEYSPDNGYFATDRIIIPIWGYGAYTFSATPTTERLVLAGWQSRAIGDPRDGRPKYLYPPGIEKSKLLYGAHLTVGGTGPVWICEGVTDCWRIGAGAVGLFGKALSSFQKLTIVQCFLGRPIVVLLDRDARQEAIRIQGELQRARGPSAGDRRVVIAELPPGRNDPADCWPAEIAEITARALGSLSVV